MQIKAFHQMNSADRKLNYDSIGFVCSASTVDTERQKHFVMSRFVSPSNVNKCAEPCQAQKIDRPTASTIRNQKTASVVDADGAGIER